MANPPPTPTRMFIDWLEFVAASPPVLYSFIKRIDNYPGPGTFPIMGERAVMYSSLRMRQAVYESLRNYESILSAARLIARQHVAHVPPDVVDHLSISFEVFDSAFDAPEGRLPMPANGERQRGWHSVRFAGWEDDGERLVFQNSWGRSWGKAGLGSVSRVYLDRYLHEAWLRRNARFGPTRLTLGRLAAARTNQDFRRAWMTENPRQRDPLRVAQRQLFLMHYEAVSAEDQAQIDVIELRSEIGTRLGWTFVVHMPGQALSIIRELFVMPPVRRLGYARLMENAAAVRASRVGSERIAIPFYAADSIPRSRAAGRKFAERCGYRWRWASSSRPAVAGVAERTL
jgi:GNAT superfamily N-acetyltransferase